MASVLTTEKLAELVRARRLLYDTKDADYKNRPKTKAAWLEIATEMGIEDGIYWASKWKALKDNYAKHKKSLAVSSSQAYKKYKNWPWAELMRFLDDFNKNRSIQSRINCYSQSQPGSTQELLNSSSTQQNLNLVKENTNISDVEPFISEIRKSSKAVNNITEPTNKLPKLTYIKHKKNEQTSKFDDVDYFFLSYAQSLKKLPNRMQSRIKLEIATLFAQYELQNEDEGASSVQQSRENPSHYSAFQNPIQSPLSSDSSTESRRPHSADSNSSAVPREIFLPITTVLRETATPETNNIAQEDSDSDTLHLSKYSETVTYTLELDDDDFK